MESGNAGTWKCQRGAYEHGCEFAPVARRKKMKSKFLVPLAVLMEHPGSENKPDITSHECRKKTGITFPTPLQIF
jgi:hypothetical protein